MPLESSIACCQESVIALLDARVRSTLSCNSLHANFFHATVENFEIVMKPERKEHSQEARISMSCYPFLARNFTEPRCRFELLPPRQLTFVQGFMISSDRLPRRFLHDHSRV